MQQYIIRFGGLIPTYYAGDHHTCHHTEAKKFDSIKELREQYGYKSESVVGISIIDAETLKFIEWYHY